MSEKRMYHFGYALPSHSGREPGPARIRDTGGAGLLVYALSKRGYELVDTIINYPHRRPREIIPVDTSFLGRDHVIVSTGRPPLDDDEYLDSKKKLDRSYTSLEEALFRPLRRYFRWCSRPEVDLTDEAANISEEIAQRQSMRFSLYTTSGYSMVGSPKTDQYRRYDSRDRTTAAFLVFADEAWAGGPKVLWAFGMDATTTLGWCHLLATRFSHLLCTTSFAMAEITPTKPRRPRSLDDLVRAWNVRILGTAPLDPDRKNAA